MQRTDPWFYCKGNDYYLYPKLWKNCTTSQCSDLSSRFFIGLERRHFSMGFLRLCISKYINILNWRVLSRQCDFVCPSLLSQWSGLCRKQSKRAHNRSSFGVNHRASRPAIYSAELHPALHEIANHAPPTHENLDESSSCRRNVFNSNVELLGQIWRSEERESLSIMEMLLNLWHTPQVPFKKSQKFETMGGWPSSQPWADYPANQDQRLREKA